MIWLVVLVDLSTDVMIVIYFSQIVYLGWVAERIEQCAEVWQNWDPKFLILKGSDVCFFDSPPVINFSLICVRVKKL